jgi:hypothetical protein
MVSNQNAARSRELAVPVVVHHMHSPAFPAQRVAERVPGHLLEKYFLPDGAFNAIWAKSKANIVFRLVGVQTCRYSLTDFGYFEEHTELPAPSSDRDLFPSFVRRYNAANQRPDDPLCQPAIDASKAPVLDLYIFWKINTWAGWAQPPRAKPGQPPRGGAVWLDTDVLTTEDDFYRLFAHEVGHFFELRHTCRAVTQEPDSTGLRECTQELERRLMGPAYQGTLLLDSETALARRSAERLFHP